MNKKTKKIVIIISIVAICLFLWNFSSNKIVCNQCHELKDIAEPHMPNQSIHKPHFLIERMHYRARVPKFQKECENFLYSDEIVSGKSQVGQDAFLFWNFFANSIADETLMYCKSLMVGMFRELARAERRVVSPYDTLL